MRKRWKTLITGSCVTVLLMSVLSGCSMARAEGYDEKSRPVSQTPVKEEQEEKKDLGILKYVTPQEYASAEGINIEAGTHIAVVGKEKTSAYWKAVKRGAEEAVKDINAELGYTGSDKVYMTYDAPATEGNVDQQINILDEVLDDFPSALCLAVSDKKAFETQIGYAVENSIPVVAFDSGTENEDLLTLSATDNRAAAAEAAVKLCEMINDEGQVAVMVHNDYSQTGIDRMEGFVAEIEANHPGVEIVDISYLTNPDEAPEDAVKRVLAMYPELKGYFSTNNAAEEVVRTVCENDEDAEVRKVAFDGAAGEISALKAGTLDGTILQNPYAIGYTTVMAAARSIMEDELPERIDTGHIWVTKDDLEKKEIKELLK